MKFAYLIEPPFNDRDEAGNITGCDVDLARYVTEQLNMEEFQAIETEFAALLPGVTMGRWRMTTGLFKTEERQGIAAFSRPIWALPDGLLVKAGNPLNLSGYSSVTAHGSCILAVIRDQFQHRSAVGFGVPDSRIQVFETYAEAAQAICDGRAHAYASVSRAHSGFIERHPSLDLELVGVPTHEKEPAFGSFAFAKSDREFRRAVDTILTATSAVQHTVR